MKKIVFSALVCAALAGCATSPVPATEAVPVPADRVLAFKDRQDGGATMVVIRDSGFIGSGCFLALSVNGVTAVRIGPTERAELSVPVGELLLRVGHDPQARGLCSFGTQWTQRETIMRAGERKVFRLSINADGQFDVMRGAE